MSNYKNPRVEPDDHALGRSRGGLSTKVHTLTDGCGRPLVILVGPGQGGDSPMLPILLEQLRVARVGPGRPRTTPLALLGDKAYAARAHRAMLHRRGIKVVIPEKADRAKHRLARGSAGGRAPSLDAEHYKKRNVVERGFNTLKQWRALATRYDKLAITYRAGCLLRAILTWCHALGDTP